MMTHTSSQLQIVGTSRSQPTGGVCPQTRAVIQQHVPESALPHFLIKNSVLCVPVGTHQYCFRSKHSVSRIIDARFNPHNQTRCARGLVQYVFSPPPRQSTSPLDFILVRRVAALKTLCIMLSGCPLGSREKAGGRTRQTYCETCKITETPGDSVMALRYFMK